MTRCGWWDLAGESVRVWAAMYAGGSVLGSHVVELLRGARWLLHRIDVSAGKLLFLRVDHDRLASASFIDGRTQITDGAARTMSIAEALAAADELPPPPPRRFIFHVAFCGSTLLSRILTRPGRSLVLREPNVLVDLANWTAALAKAGRRDERLAPLVRLAAANLSAPWAPDEKVTIKPSNWATNLLPDLCEAGVSRCVFIESPARQFLTAVFRGGHDRIRFVIQTAAHLAAGRRESEALVEAAATSAGDGLDQAARLCLLAHHFELEAFRDLLDLRSSGHSASMSSDTIEKAPSVAAQVANLALDLRFTEEELAAGIGQNATRHAKDPTRRYSPAEYARADADLEHHHGGRFDRALAWGECHIPRPSERTAAA